MSIPDAPRGAPEPPSPEPTLTLPFAPIDVLPLAREAGEMALAMRSNARVEIKSDETLVTAADRAVEAFLRRGLARLAPSWSFLGEEGGLEGSDQEPCWVIDPIDGTTNYARDLPLWCVSIGAVWRGRAIFGLIAVPPTGEILLAAPGFGAHLLGPRGSSELRLRDAAVLQQEDLIAINTTVERTLDFGDIPCRVRNFGALAYHLAALGKGSLVAIIAHYHKIYDVAAGICICEQAGAIARYLDGTPWQARVSLEGERRPLLVASPATMELLLSQLQRRS